MFSGITIYCNPVQFLNASLPIEVRVGGNSISVKDLHPSKAFVPILVTEGITNVFKLLHP